MKRIALSLVTVFALGSLVAGVAFAVFSDTETITGNTLAMGTMELTVNKSSGKPFGVTNAYPGYLSSVEFIDIFNDGNKGTLPFEAYMRFAQNGGNTELYNKLTIKLWTDTDSNCTTMGSGEAVIYDGYIKHFGTRLVSTELFWGHANEEDNSGSPADNIRVGYSERICQQVGVHSSADNSVMGTSVTFDEIVDAHSDND